MSEVSIEINGRKYRMACEDGQEGHLQELALRFDSHVNGFKGEFGEVGDNRLTVMAGISVVDALVEAEKKLEALRSELEQITAAGRSLADENEALELKFAQRMSDAARKIELAATVVEAATSDTENA